MLSKDFWKSVDFNWVNIAVAKLSVDRKVQQQLCSEINTGVRTIARRNDVQTCGRVAGIPLETRGKCLH